MAPGYILQNILHCKALNSAEFSRIVTLSCHCGNHKRYHKFIWTCKSRGYHTMEHPLSESGGFLPDGLPSPVPTPSRTSRTNLPQPRSQPLRAGSAKEETARRYVEGRLLHVSRRYTKKYQPAEPGDDMIGYTNIRDPCKDLSEIVDVLWLSGTPSLQIPYLLNIALSFGTYLTAFPPDPTPTFAILRKLDHAFASLLLGQDIESGHALPGSQGDKAILTRTDMVRCKSLVEGIRVLIVEVMTKEGPIDTIDPADSDTSEQRATDVDTVDINDNEILWDDEKSHEMDVARVFEKTIIQLGVSLESSTAYSIGAD